ncbi:hypothetical protein [Methylobacterium planeticum]|uniref:Uncharacterized protein n=1 Tax=Methylobacterium planeticum TaxID=2615211 RepID=A0A6N6MFG4_9HYPH|nr:hypothetical protein [Methylobacterium planeticum]KAB1068126.1 hypothetical protein F6X51_27260 [Methylobacterium planeticum]
MRPAASAFGRPAPFRTAAAACGVLGLLCFGSIGLGSFDPASPRQAPTARADAVAAVPERVEAEGLRPARLSLGPGGRDVRLAGDLVEGTAERLAGLLAAHPGVTRLHLTSDGGLVDEGNALGDLVARHGLATYVPDLCISACTLVFMRGSARYLRADGRLGFHAPYETDPDGHLLGVDATPERGAYLAAGVAPDFIERALAVAPQDIWIPEAGELLRAGLVTDLVDADRFPDSILDEDASPGAALAVILKAFPILRHRDPADLDRIAAWYREGYRAGRSEGEARRGLHRQAAALALGAFRQAQDDAIRELGIILEAAMDAARRRGQEAACALIGAGDVVQAQDSLEAAPEESRNTGPGDAAGPVARLHALVARDAPPRAALPFLGRFLGRPGGAEPPPALAASRSCEALAAAYREALRQPAPAAAAALRGLLFREAGGRPLAAVMARP